MQNFKKIDRKKKLSFFQLKIWFIVSVPPCTSCETPFILRFLGHANFTGSRDFLLRLSFQERNTRGKSRLYTRVGHKVQRSICPHFQTVSLLSAVELKGKTSFRNIYISPVACRPRNEERKIFVMQMCGYGLVFSSHGWAAATHAWKMPPKKRVKMLQWRKRKSSRAHLFPPSQSSSSIFIVTTFILHISSLFLREGKRKREWGPWWR